VDIEENLLPKDGSLNYRPDLFDPAEAGIMKENEKKRKVN